MAGRRGATAVMALALLGLAGCGGGLKTYPVRGKVVLEDGEVRDLAGSHVEIMREDDPSVRADGKIGPDGRFDMQMLHQGKILNGAPEGTYLARIIPGEADDEGVPKPRGQRVHRRFLDFKTSGLSVKVPSGGDLTVTVSRK